MSPQCGCCGEHVGKLKQQVSVMRKEIKNLRYVYIITCSEQEGAASLHRALVHVLALVQTPTLTVYQHRVVFIKKSHSCCPRRVYRQTLASAARAHRQHMASIQAALSNIGPGDLCKEQTAPPLPAEISQAALEKG